jgi:hypothetical protein
MQDAKHGIVNPGPAGKPAENDEQEPEHGKQYEQDMNDKNQIGQQRIDVGWAHLKFLNNLYKQYIKDTAEPGNGPLPILAGLRWLAVVVEQDTPGRRIKIIKLTAPDSPEESPDRGNQEHEAERNQDKDDIHYAGFADDDV